MKNLILIFIAFSTIQFTLFAQAPNIEWAKAFGGIYGDEGTVVIETVDNGFIVGGYSHTEYLTDFHAYVIRLNDFGDTLWTSLSCYYEGYPQSTFIKPNLYELSTDNYIMGFDGNSGGLLRVRYEGDSAYYYKLKNLGSLSSPSLTGMYKTNDGNYILSYGAWGVCSCGILQKADSLGNLIWEQSYSGPIRYVIQTYDGGFAAIGKKIIGMGESLGIILRKMNSNGDTLWTKIVYADSNYSPIGNMTSKCLLQTGDGGYFILCNEHNDFAGIYSTVLFRTNELGDTLWTKKYGGSEMGNGEYFTETPDGGYIMVGSINSFGSGGSDVWLVKIDSLGNTEWTKTIGGPEDDYGKYVQVTSDSGYIVTGGTHSYGQGDHDVWVIKLTHNPVSVNNTIEIIDNYRLIQNFPNPFNPVTNIKYQIPELRFVTLKVYDVLGNEIEILVNEDNPSGTYEITWYAEDLPTGVYFYQIRAGSFVETKKMILLK